MDAATQRKYDLHMINGVAGEQLPNRPPANVLDTLARFLPPSFLRPCGISARRAFNLRFNGVARQSPGGMPLLFEEARQNIAGSRLSFN